MATNNNATVEVAPHTPGTPYALAQRELGQHGTRSSKRNLTPAQKVVRNKLLDRVKASAQQTFKESPIKEVRRLSNTLEHTRQSSEDERQAHRLPARDHGRLVQKDSSDALSHASTVLSVRVSSDIEQDSALANTRSSLDVMRTQVATVAAKRNAHLESQQKGMTAAELEHQQHVLECFKHNVAMLKELGKGGQAHVYHAKRLAATSSSPNDELKLCVKVQPALKDRDSSDIINFLLRAKPHKYISRTLDIFSRPSPTDKKLQYHYMVQELCEGKDVMSMVIGKSHHPDWIDRCNTEADVRPIIFRALKALQALHAQGAIHRDVKPENLMWDPQTRQLKLIDFGHLLLCKPGAIVHRPDQHVGAGTRFYRAPETLVGYYSAACDAWGMGITIFVLLFAYLPFQYSRSGRQLDDSEEDLSVCKGFDPRVKRGVGPFFPKTIPSSPEVRQLIAGLLATDVKKRWTIDQALDSKWFRM